MTVVSHSPFFFLQLKMKLKGFHFDTNEVIEAESQAMLNTFTEHDFQDAFKKRQIGGNCAETWKGTRGVSRSQRGGSFTTVISIFLTETATFSFK
jgi:hypothetical protein